LIVACAIALALLSAWDRAAPGEPSPARTAAQDYATVPLSFVRNHGQADRRVRYHAQAGGFGVAFTDRKAMLSFPGGVAAGGQSAEKSLHLDLRFVGASSATEVSAQRRASGTVNYVLGDDPSNWQQSIPSFSEISYQALWPGVDMAFRGQGGQLKYEFAVAPGADPSRIALAYGGAQSLAVGSGGGLRVETARGTLRDAAPVSYQVVGGRRVPVESSYALEGKSGYGFELGPYDHSRPLVIDPGIGYATYLGGGGGLTADYAEGIAVDDDGSAYVVGFTGATDFPTTAGAADAGHNGNYDVYVAKLAPDGGSLEYSTFLGGPGQDNGFGIAIDDAGAAYVTGSAQTGFPTTAGASDTTFGGGSHDVFVAKLAPDGGSLAYSTYHGAGAFDEGQAIDVDAAGNAYVTGYAGPGFPTTPGAWDTTQEGNSDAFVVKLAPGGGSVSYATVIGAGPQEEGRAIAVDSAGSAYVTGGAETQNPAFGNYPTTAGAFDTTVSAGSLEAFATKLAPDGGSLAYSTLLGASGGERGRGIDVDGSGNAYVVGTTCCGTVGNDYPTTPGALQTTRNAASRDGFITKVAPTGAALAYSSFLGGGATTSGGGADDGATDVVVNGSGEAYVTGFTDSTDFPVTSDAYQSTRSPSLPIQGYDSFATHFSAGGGSLAYSTYFRAGASQFSEAAKGIDVNPAGRIFIAGSVESARMTATPGAFDTTGQGAVDPFVARLDPVPVPDPQCSDAVDNDGDTQTDFPDDQGCDSATDDSENSESAPTDPGPTPPTPGPPVDSTAPETTITASPPAKVKVKRRYSASFEFTSSEAGSRFECKLDAGSFSPCSSPFKAKLVRGSHSYNVRATDAAGNVDASPATDQLKVKKKHRSHDK
jgi:hypothetical protein